MTIAQTYREIARLYALAADSLDEAERLRDSLRTEPRDDHEPTAALVERAESQAEDAEDAEAVSRAIDRLGWDPDTKPALEVAGRIQSCSLAQLDDVDALEGRRATMRPARAVRTTVINAIERRRSELVTAAILENRAKGTEP